MIEIDRDTLRDFERAASLEWLETDALGQALEPSPCLRVTLGGAAGGER